MSKIYVLGAGFAVHAGLPVLGDFFDKVQDSMSATATQEEKLAFQRTLRLRTDKYCRGYDMESAFGAIWNGRIRRFGFVPEERNGVIKDFLYTVCRTFHLCWCANREESKCLYGRSLERFKEEAATLITFNYDLILDNLLFDKRELPDYGFELGQKNTINFESLHPSMRKGRIRLLKLHGSQNWFRCNCCSGNNEFAKIDTCDTWSSDRGCDGNSSSGETCLACKQKTMDYHIVPPLTGKQKPCGVFLKAVWDTAQSAVQEAEKMVFVGYSFPESDRKIRTVFKTWLEGNRCLSSVKVIDPKADTRCFQRRFNKVFEDAECGRDILEFIPERFEDHFGGC